eukprot:5949710-Amphidinium_carterae.1
MAPYVRMWFQTEMPNGQSHYSPNKNDYMTVLIFIRINFLKNSVAILAQGRRCSLNRGRAGGGL